MKTALFILAFITVVCAEKDSAFGGVFHVNASMVFKTTDQKASESQLCLAIEKMGGWLLKGTRQEIRFRLPQVSVDTFLTMIDSFGVSTDNAYTRTDYTDNYLNLVASLQAKEYLLKQYFEILDSSGTEGIYPVSREIADLQNGIEMLKGQIRGIIERMNYAEIVIYFNFNDRRVPLVSGHSDFEWLNTVNLPALLEDFR
jgi:Domain of unknown function (DUF4349)